jgi:hypothetical protein
MGISLLGDKKSFMTLSPDLGPEGPPGVTSDDIGMAEFEDEILDDVTGTPSPLSRRISGLMLEEIKSHIYLRNLGIYALVLCQ